MAGTYTLERRYFVYLLLFYSVVSTLYCWAPSIHSAAKGALARENSAILQEQRNSSAHNTSSDFPHNIWQTARSNIFTLDSSIQSAIQTWLDKNKYHRYELITAERSDSYVTERFTHRPDLVRDFLSLRDSILRADLLRYLFLHTDGGVYTDLDTICGKPIDTWIPAAFKDKANLVLGIEGDSYGGGLREGFTYHVQFATWTMAAKPGHFIIGMIIDHVLNQLHNLAAKQNTTISNIKADYMDVMDTTGPGVFAGSVYQGLSQISGSNVTSANLTGLNEPMLIGDVLIMPLISFGAFDLDNPSALVQHTFAGTWKADHPLAGAEEQLSEGEGMDLEEADVIGEYDDDDEPNEKSKMDSSMKRI